MRVFFGAHHAHFAHGLVKQYGGLLHLAAVFERFNLPADFRFDGFLQETEGVEIFDFAARAEFFVPPAAHRDVGVTAKRAFLQVAVANVNPAHQRVQRAGVGDSFGGAAHVGFRDDFQQRRTGAVQINAAHALKIFVQAFAGVFFQMRAREMHGFFICRIAFAHAKRHTAANDHGQFKLADLIAFGQVGIKIVFARKDAARGYFAANAQTKTDGTFDRATVQHRQHAGQRQVNRAGLAVRLGAEGGRRAGKDFGGGIELHMGFDADDNFPVRRCSAVHGSEAQAAERTGRRQCQSVLCWKRWATSSRRASEKCGPISCAPMGRPSSEKPHGCDRPGRPARFTARV